MNRRSLLRGLLTLPVAARFAPVVRAPLTTFTAVDWAYGGDVGVMTIFSIDHVSKVITVCSTTVLTGGKALAV